MSGDKVAGDKVSGHRKSRALLGLDRNDFSRCIRWLTGFAFLRSKNFQLGLDDGDICRICAQAPEKAEHIFRECPALNQHRWECFGVFQLAPGVEWEVQSLLKFLADERVRSLEDSAEDGEATRPPDIESEEEEI